MAKSSCQKLRQRKDKEGNLITKVCDVCGKPLVVGETYKSVWNFYNQWDMHCECYSKCPRSRWESSEYKGSILDIQDGFNKDEIDSTIGALEDLQYELEDKLENIPEQLRDADAGSLIQERIDKVDEVRQNIEMLSDEINDIYNWEYEDYKDEYSTEEFEDYKEQEIDGKVSEMEDELYELDI